MITTDTTRPFLRLALATVAAVAAVLVALCAGGDDDAHATTTTTAADYATQGRWPGTDPMVCVQDETQGFPVEQAAAEFDDLPVDFFVATDCTGHVNVVRVVPVINDEATNSGWFRSERDEHGRYESATIWLNTGQAFRLDPHAWRMVLVHELGHAAGLAHTYEGDSVMHPHDYAHHDGLTDADRAQIEGLYAND